MHTYLSGNFAPVSEEVTVTDLQVKGTLPAELNGRYVRNGPNPVVLPEPANYHWFLGDGMVHGLCLRDGKAAWYRNRFVGSDAIAKELSRPISGPNWSGSAHGANTNVAGFAGRTWAVVEAGSTPVELTYELDSVARNDFFGTLPGAFTAHPKLDPTTGELHAMVYAPTMWFDHVQYVVVGRDGRVRRSVDIPLGMSMLHDMSLTDKYAIVFDLPVTVDLDLAFSGVGFPFRWNPDYGARVGLLPREGEASEIVWIEVPLCYAYHPMNAYDCADGTVVIDICTYDRMFVHDVNGPLGDAAPRLERWTLNPASCRSSVTTIDTTPQEFPRHAPGVGNRPYRYGYSVAIGADPAGATLKHDLHTGHRSSYDYGPGRGAGEAVFVPRESSTEEDDGWLLAFTHHLDGSAASFVVLDAQDIERGPVAEVALPQRVPYGFHGNWISDRAVAPLASGA
jgi:8'-apo-carotenoid 13,14-cleaving dioxygenase